MRFKASATPTATHSALTVINVGFIERQTTGSMAAASTTLTVASATGFAIGNKVIVAVGGEAGLGQRGTTGVGGVWAATTSDPNLYYTNTDAPKALNATISNIVGNVMTLDTPSVAATTNARVYFDNKPIWLAVIAAGGNPGPLTNRLVQLPAGTFAAWGILFANVNAGMILQGRGSDQTTLLSPDGAEPTYFISHECPGGVYKDFHVHSNFRLNGYGIDPSFIYPNGLFVTTSPGAVIQNIKSTDVGQRSVGLQYSENCRVYNCRTIMTAPLARYIQWFYQAADGLNNLYQDCTVDSPWLVPGFETFRSSGDRFIRCGGRNTAFSINTSGSFLFKDCWTTIEANSQYSELSFSANNPVLNVNSNIDPTSPLLAEGGTISNFVSVQAGYINAANDTLRGIVINANNPNVTVNGGSYTAPNYASPSTLFGPWGFDSTGLNTNLSNFTVVGTPKPTIPNIRVSNGSITGCTATTIVGP